MQCWLEKHKHGVFHLKVPGGAFFYSAQTKNFAVLASMLVAVIVNPSPAKLGAPVVVLWNYWQYKTIYCKKVGCQLFGFCSWLMRSTIHESQLQICAATNCVRNAGSQGYLSIHFLQSHIGNAHRHTREMFLFFVRISESTFRIVCSWQTPKNLLCLLHSFLFACMYRFDSALHIQLSSKWFVSGVIWVRIEQSAIYLLLWPLVLKWT